MCDIYTARCGGPGCKRTFEIHLVDFVLPRKKVRVFCESHLPHRDVMVFKILPDGEDMSEAGELFGIRVNDFQHRENEDITLNGNNVFCGYRSPTRRKR